MKPRELLRTGITGSALTSICCFTPFLETIFNVFGLITWLEWINYILFPMLGIFLVLTIFAIERIRRNPTEGYDDTIPPTSQ